MIKVSVFYPNHEGSQFDMEYYCNSHMAMVREKLGSALKAVSIDRGLTDGSTRSAPAFKAIGHLFFATLEAFQVAIAPYNDTFLKDIPNYTDIRPIIQISEEVLPLEGKAIDQ